MTRSARLIGAVLLAALGGCRSSDPACAGRTAADVAPAEATYRAMNPEQRREAARAFDALARRCGWEP